MSLIDKQLAIFNRKESFKYINPLISHEPSITSWSLFKKISRKMFIPLWYQRLISDIFKPDTNISRLLILGEPGIGKTMIAWNIIVNFANRFGENSNLTFEDPPVVFVLTFQDHIFIEETIRYSELGFITSTERFEYLNIKNKILTEKLSDATINELKTRRREILTTVKERITEQVKGRKSKIIFMGYQKLANKLLDIGKSSDIEQWYDSESEETVVDYMDRLDQEGVIKINYDFLESFHNSLIVCDEFHSMYNRESLNSRGIALIYILNKAKNIRLIGTDATPIMSKATQLISVLNIFIPDCYFRVNDFFNKQNKFMSEKKDELNKLILGRIFSVKNMNLSIFPTISLEGEMISITNNSGDRKNITELNFVKAIMSGTQKKICNTVKYRENTITNEIVLLNDNDDVITSESELVSSKKYKYNVDIQMMANDKQFKIIRGSFLKYENLDNYACKYKQMLETLFIIKSLKGGGGKITIMDLEVELPGVNLIESIMLENGFARINDKPTPETRCFNCKYSLKNHKGQTHEYYPSRIAVLHTYIHNKDFTKILEDFNSEENIYGKYINILIGSSKIGVGIDFNSIQHIILTKIPPSVNDTRQRIGRGARANAMSMLLSEFRHLHVYILCSFSNSFNTIDVIRWYDSIQDKHEINVLEDIMNSSSITVPFYKKNFSKNICIYVDPKIYKSNLSTDPSQIKEFLSPSFKETVIRLPEIDTTKSIGIRKTIIESEMLLMIKIIKILMIKYQLRSVEQLWKDIKNSPIALGINTKYLNKSIFYIAIKHLLNDMEYRNVYEMSKDSRIDIELQKENAILDTYSKHFILKRHSKRLILINNKLLLLLPVTPNNTPILTIPYVYGTVIQYKIHPINIAKNLRDSNDNKYELLLKDIESIVDSSDIYDFFEKFSTATHKDIIKDLIKNKYHDSITIKQEEYLKFLQKLEYVFTYKIACSNNIIKKIVDNQNIKNDNLLGCFIVSSSVFIYKPREETWIELDDTTSPRIKYKSYKFLFYFII